MLLPVFLAFCVGLATSIHVNEFHQAELDFFADDNCACTKHPILQCGCCYDFKIHEKSHKVCANVSYVEGVKGMRITVTLDGKVLLNLTLSAKNPPPFCQGIKPFAYICEKYSNMSYGDDDKWGGCLEIYGGLIVQVLDVKFGCFYLPGHTQEQSFQAYQFQLKQLQQHQQQKLLQQKQLQQQQQQTQLTPQQQLLARRQLLQQIQQQQQQRKQQQQQQWQLLQLQQQQRSQSAVQMPLGQVRQKIVEKPALPPSVKWFRDFIKGAVVEGIKQRHGRTESERLREGHKGSLKKILFKNRVDDEENEDVLLVIN